VSSEVLIFILENWPEQQVGDRKHKQKPLNTGFREGEQIKKDTLKAIAMEKMCVSKT